MPYIPPEVVAKAREMDLLSRCATHAVNYLAGRGIDYELIDFCIQTGRLPIKRPAAFAAGT